MPEAFTFFWKSPLSQWQCAPFVVGGITFTHAEQFMMYAKALLFGDRDAAARILTAEKPREQQAIGRTVRGFDEAIWVLFRKGVVFQANYARFTQNPEQRELLLATKGTTLVEASPDDRVWGIGLSADDPRALDRTQWRGLNLLGQALTHVREVLLWEQTSEVPSRKLHMPGTSDPFNLKRFLEAQTDDYATALAELEAGKKTSHWMWYIFPQFDGLGHSSMSKRYAIKSVEEAKAYLAHPVLGPRLLECAKAILGVEGRSAYEIMNSPDDAKLQSCATLFASVSPAGSVFQQILDKYYGGKSDEQTLRLLQR